MSLYLDASVLVALFVLDPMSARATAFLSAHPAIAVISDFGSAEFSSAVSRRVRMRDLTPDEAELAFLHFDTWAARTASRHDVAGADIGAAERMLRRIEINLRTPDAIHIAICQRVGATLVTFDNGMAIAARGLGVAVATL